jgi:hypothetical protein
MMQQPRKKIKLGPKNKTNQDGRRLRIANLLRQFDVQSMLSTLDEASFEAAVIKYTRCLSEARIGVTNRIETISGEKTEGETSCPSDHPLPTTTETDGKREKNASTKGMLDYDSDDQEFQIDRGILGKVTKELQELLKSLKLESFFSPEEEDEEFEDQAFEKLRKSLVKTLSLARAKVLAISQQEELAHLVGRKALQIDGFLGDHGGFEVHMPFVFVNTGRRNFPLSDLGQILSLQALGHYHLRDIDHLDDEFLTGVEIESVVLGKEHLQTHIIVCLEFDN